jgi:hypothetical protein
MTTETRMRGTSHCTACGRPVRGSRTPLDEQPGTVVHGGAGKCITCYKRQRDGKEPYAGHIKPSTAANARDARNLMIFNLFIADRRRRGIPEEGLISA